MLPLLPKGMIMLMEKFHEGILEMTKPKGI